MFVGEKLVVCVVEFVEVGSSATNLSHVEAGSGKSNLMDVH